MTSLLRGWGVEDMDRAARIAVHRRRYLAADRIDLYGAAWDGITELLCTTAEDTSWFDLLAAADKEITRFRDGRRTHHGWSRELGGDQTRPNFLRYWHHAHTTSSPVEDAVIERVATEQILDSLPAKYGHVLQARSSSDTLDRAAELAGYARRTMADLVIEARRGFLELWHEHETPRVTSGKQMIRRDSAPAPCGTVRGHARHVRRRERCEACKQAQTEYVRQWRASRVDQPGGGS